MSEKNYDDETLDAICDGLDYRGHQTGAEAIRQLRAANARLVAAGDAIEGRLIARDGGPHGPKCPCTVCKELAAWRAAKEQQT